MSLSRNFCQHCGRTEIVFFVNSLLLLNELDIAERLRRQLDSLIETIFTTITDVDNLDNLSSQPWVEQV